MEKQITINNKVITVKELKAIDLDDIDWADKKNAIKKQVQLSTGLTDEEYVNLSIKERLIVVQAINEVNGLEDFQKHIQQN